jgi:hypothetical protein
MRLLLIGCEVILRELCDAVARSPHIVDVTFLTKGLHDLGGKAMRIRLQEEIDKVDPGKYDAVVLGYGLCGNGLAGLEARAIPVVIPRAHDCIALLMGSREVFARFFRENPGVYYRSAGWVERGSELLPLARGQTGYGMTLDALVEKYGEDNGRFLYDEFTRYQENYSQLTYIETGLEPDSRFEDQSRAEADEKGWKFQSIRGDLSLFHRLLAGDWNDDFLVLQPGERVVSSYDDRVVTAERINP